MPKIRESDLVKPALTDNEDGIEVYSEAVCGSGFPPAVSELFTELTTSNPLLTKS